MQGLKGIVSPAIPAESTDLDPWGSQSPNHQPRNIYRLDLGLPAHVEQMYSLFFMWLLINWNRGYPKSCQSMGSVLLADLHCLDLVGEDVPNPAET